MTAPGSAPVAWPALSICAGVTATAAVNGLGVCGLLPAPVAAGWTVLAIAAVWALLRWPSGRAAAVRRTTARPVVLAALVLTGALALGWARRADTTSTELVRGLGTTLSYPLALLLVAQLASAATLRELGVVLVGSLLAAVLAIGTMPTPTPPEIASGFALSLAIGWAAGLATLWFLLRAKDQAEMSYVLGGRDRGQSRGLSVLIAGSAALALLALLLPHPGGFRPLGVEGADGSGSGSGGPAARSPQNYLSGMDLSARGELPTTRLLDVPADSPTLWGSTQLDTYDGRTWGGSGRAGQLAPRDAAGDYDLRRGAVPGLQPGTADRSDLVRVLDHAFLPLLAPGQPVSVRIDDPVAFSSTRAIPIAPGSSYLMRSNGSIRGTVTAMDTALPSSLPARVRDLADRLARGAPTPGAKAAAIEAYLHAHERYRLDSPVPDADEDAVDDFLFESHEGFCEHFASAEAVLLRAMGVPARIVTGFAGGTDEGDRRVLLGSDAHAWVQLHVGDGVWVWTDPTAGAELAPDRPDDRSGGLGRAILSFLRAHWLLLAALSLGAGLVSLVGLLVARRVRARRARARALAAPLAVQVLAAFAALEDAMGGTSLARPPSASVQELAARLAARWPGGLPDAERTVVALTVVQRVLYDRRPVPADSAREALATLEDLTARADEARKVVVATRV